MKLLGIWLELSVVTLKRISFHQDHAHPPHSPSPHSSRSHSACGSVADRPATTVVRPRVQSRKNKAAEEKDENGKRRSARVGTTHRTTFPQPRQGHSQANATERTPAKAHATRAPSAVVATDFWAEESVPLSVRNGASNHAPHPRPTPTQPPVNPALGAGAFRLTLLRKRA